MARSLDIRSNYPWPSCALSNFAKWPFKMQGISFGGMEGFLQGCKVQNNEFQTRIFQLAGLNALHAGRSYARSTTRGTLYFNGVQFSRFSPYWKKLYTTAYIECIRQNPGFRKALCHTYGRILTHEMADSYSEEQTILTAKEFCDTLTNIREILCKNQ